MTEPAHDAVRIGIVSISDRASSGAYQDRACPRCRTGSPAP